MVIVNEFGDVGIDGMLLKDTGLGVVELIGGCVCYTLKMDLQRTLRGVWDQFKQNRVLIEASSVA